MPFKQLLKVDGRRKALSFLVASAVMWSFGGLFIKYIQWNPMAIAGMRGLIAALAVALAVPESVRLPPNRFIWLCAFAYAGMCGTLVVATKLTTAANAIFLQYTAPVYVMLISAFFFREKIKFPDAMVILSTVLGMALFFVGEFSFASIAGNLIGISSGVCFAVMVTGFRFVKGAEPAVAIFCGNIILFLLSAPFMRAPIPGTGDWLALLFLGVFQIGISYAMYSRAIVRVKPLEGVIIPTIEPVLNPLWVFFFIGERPPNAAIAGGAIVITAITVYCLRKN
ncbi:MAG: DMT family transporter [Acidaminococcales bacterium]|jgi:drug/metabolite transporter (DMT)-like permease|nr:DMT family transporter [Acidaminococcales bacterium]